MYVYTKLSLSSGLNIYKTDYTMSGTYIYICIHICIGAHVYEYMCILTYKIVDRIYSRQTMQCQVYICV
jgi:hypothetical protein